VTPGAVATACAGILGALTVLVLWGPSAFLAALLVWVTVAVVQHELDLTSPAPREPADLEAPPPATELVLTESSSGLPVTGWSDAELCRAWRVSYAQLQTHGGAARAEHLAEQRRTYLDELQRRSPAGFAAWIASGARAGGDPARYLSPVPPVAP
jgi:hypothetical protein